MKNLPLVIILAVVAIGLVWLVRLGPGGQEDTDAPPDTEVAVRVGTIVRTTLRAYVTAYGTVEPAPAGEQPAASAKLAPSVPGIVVAVSAVEGQHVAKGDVLFQLDSRAANVAAEFAEKAVERQKRLIQIEGTSQKSLQESEQQLDAARVQQALLRVQSPLAGTVTRVNARPGEAVDLTTVLAEVVDLDRLVVGASVPSAELAGLRNGQPAEVLLDRSSAPIPGTLNFIGSEVNAQTGTAVVRVALPAGSSLRPGQFVTVRIVSVEHADRLAVPVESVVKDEQGSASIAVVENGMAVRRPVQTGLRDGGLVEVEADGLRADMTVVTEGAYGLPAETKVRVLGD
jgi:membrane fusion protein (multidrug efflux system)